jgi:hypothetical protein
MDTDTRRRDARRQREETTVHTRTTPNYRRLLSFAAFVHVAIIAVLMNTVAVTPATAHGTVSPSMVEFTRQPANAQVNERIRSTAYSPASDPVQVTVFDQFHNVAASFEGTILLTFKSNPGNGILAGAVEEPVIEGRADFPNIWITQSGFGYRLHAVACPGGCDSSLRGGFIGPADSHKFDIVDVRKICGEGACESGDVTDTDGHTTAHMETSDGAPGDVLIFSVSPGVLNCASYHETSSLVTFTVTGTRTKTVTVVVPRSSARNLSSYQVCYSSPNSFRARNGLLVKKGLLPDCDAGPNDPAPCVVSRAFDGSTVVIVFSAPRGDPKGRI